MPVLAIPDESMDVSVCDPEVQTLLVGTGEALRIHPLWCSPAAFHLTPGARLAGAGLTLEEERRQRGHSSGVRGLRRRCNVVCLLPAGEREG